MCLNTFGANGKWRSRCDRACRICSVSITSTTSTSHTTTSTTYPLTVGECSRMLVIKFGEGSAAKMATMEKWYLVELMTLRYTAGENQGCEELFTADCTKSAIIREKTCLGGQPLQVSESCVSDKKCGASA